MPMRAVIFDVGGVLLRTDNGMAHRAWEQRLGLPAEGLTVAVWRSQAGDRAVVGDGDAPTVWQSFAAEHRLTPAELAQLQADFYGGERVDPELVQFVRSLRPRYKTALLSNAYANARELFTHKLRIHDITDELIISAEVGLAKPDPRMYLLAAERLGVQPHQAIFVDDVPGNVEAAQAVGMIGIQFRSTAQTITDIGQHLAE